MAKDLTPWKARLQELAEEAHAEGIDFAAIIGNGKDATIATSVDVELTTWMFLRAAQTWHEQVEEVVGR